MEEDVTFTCSHSGESNPGPNRYTFYNDGNKEQNKTSSTWGPISFTSVNDGGPVSCVASNEIGEAQDSDEMQITVEGIIITDLYLCNNVKKIPPINAI